MIVAIEIVLAALVGGAAYIIGHRAGHWRGLAEGYVDGYIDVRGTARGVTRAFERRYPGLTIGEKVLGK